MSNLSGLDSSAAQGTIAALRLAHGLPGARRRFSGKRANFWCAELHPCTFPNQFAEKGAPMGQNEIAGVVFAGLSPLPRREPFEPDALYLWSVAVCDVG
jgi:hypothetical protein